MIMDKIKVAVIFGGNSSEYDVSLQSAHGVISNMNKERYDLILIGITRQGEWYRFNGDINAIINDSWCNESSCVRAIISPDREAHGLIEFHKNENKLTRIDIAFPVMHGKNGEDGTIQGLLQLAGIPVVGCGMLSSSLCMDKNLAHRLVELQGIRVPKAVVFQKGDTEEKLLAGIGQLTYPVFVKPINSGSSFGITKVNEETSLMNAVRLGFLYDDFIIIEETIEGFEVGCAVLGNSELIIGQVDEIELAEGFFNYTEKYSLKTSKIHMPARINQQLAVQVKKTAEIIYRTLGCKGFARVDMFLTPKGEIVFNEVNTIPGFTSHSRFPNMLKGIGLTYQDIIEAIIKLTEEV